MTVHAGPRKIILATKESDKAGGGKEIRYIM